MITRLNIVGFKRFARVSLEFAPLTVLAGLNGAGKTTVIHALLLAREASMPGAVSVALNGPFGLELGETQDVLNFGAGIDDPSIEIDLLFKDGATADFKFDASQERMLHLPIKERPETIPGAFGGSHRMFTYLSAERLGPRDVLGASALPADDVGVGVRGEYCAHVLALHELTRKERVSPERRHPEKREDAQSFLKYQVEAWLSDIVRNVEINTEWFPGTSVTALRFRAPNKEWVRAPNMGFGVSYSLPIVLAGLIAPTPQDFGSGDRAILIVENPEAHLHPVGQSRMGVFLATVAAAGIQVVLETHSDHVLNGIRRAVGEHATLKSEDAAIHFFADGDSGAPTIDTLHFTASGGLSHWPSRFFDQYQVDVAALSRVRRGGPDRTR